MRLGPLQRTSKPSKGASKLISYLIKIIEDHPKVLDARYHYLETEVRSINHLALTCSIPNTSQYFIHYDKNVNQLTIHCINAQIIIT